MRNWFWLLLFLLFAAGCALFEEEGDPPVMTETPAIPTPVDSPAEQNTPAVPPQSTPVQSPLVLRLWTTPEIAPRAELPGGQLLLEQLNAFDASRPQLELFVELKTVNDQGGSLSYLRTGRSVAPAILPDVILLPTAQLPDAVSEGLVYPLDNLLDAETLNDLYPVARDLAEVDGELYGYPFALSGLKHLVYNQTTITKTLPSEWNDLVARGEENSLIFPAAGPVGGELTLQLYLEAGGALQSADGRTTLDVEALTTALQWIHDGTVSNFISAQSGSTATVQQAWQLYQTSPIDIAETTAGHFLRQRAEGTTGNTGFAPLPGPGGPMRPLLSGWSWAITTSDPVRQAAAADLITWLVSAENLGEWSLQSYILPARRAALDTWGEDDPYFTFLQRQLVLANPLPAQANNTVLLALTEATTDVILQLSTPAGAAAQAAAALQP